MENPLISVIVPCYNVEKYVAECLKSIVEQSYENLEIIVVNDGATDNTEREILPFLEDKRVKYIVQKNQGLSGARNTGLDNMKGEYVCFVDSDDFIHPDFVKTLYQNLAENGADISIADVLLYYKNSQIKANENKKLTIYNRDSIMQAINGDWKLIIACGKLYKSKLFNDLRFEMGRIHEDEFLAHHIFWKTEKVVMTSLELYFYRQVEGSIMKSNYTNKKMQDCIDCFDDRISFYNQNNIPNTWKIYNTKWLLIVERGIRQHNLGFAKKYFINNIFEFLTNTTFSRKAKLKMIVKFLLSLIKK